MTLVRRGIEQMGAGEFEARCLGVLDDVARTGREVLITKRGKAVARLVPVEPPLGLVGSIVHEDDIVAPVGERRNVDDR